ncbi:MAG: GYDIA family GHMP kinase [Bacteroidales bacterium]
MKCESYSRGKLLLTGEYLVLKGGEGIALPLKVGQYMRTEPLHDNKIIWETTYKSNIIFQAAFSLFDFSITRATDNTMASYLQRIFKKVAEYSRFPNGMMIKTELEFPFNWGLGSSSTLINNIATCFDIDAFKINNAITGGSGYDIACARSEKPIIYKSMGESPLFYEIDWKPPFSGNIYFAYTGHKQNSEKEVSQFLRKNLEISEYLKKLENINQMILRVKTLEAFEEQIDKHDNLLSEITGKNPASQAFLPGFPGKIKWLGAWGGDFILLTWRENKNELKRYLKRHNLSIFFQWNEIIK